MMVLPWLPTIRTSDGIATKAVPFLLGIMYLGFALSIYRSRPPKGLERYEDELQGSDFTDDSFKFAEAPEFESRKEVAEWVIAQAQALAVKSNAKFKATIVSDSAIRLDLGRFWLTLGQISSISALGKKHGFDIEVSGSGQNPFIPDECYKNR